MHQIKGKQLSEGDYSKSSTKSNISNSPDKRAVLTRVKPYIVFGLSLFIIFYIYDTLFSDPTPQTILEYTILEEQGFCDYCDGCYCFNGSFQSCVPGNCGFCMGVLGKSHGDRVGRFFANEFEIHDEWSKGDLLELTWKPTVYGWRVRGVKLYEKAE